MNSGRSNANQSYSTSSFIILLSMFIGSAALAQYTSLDTPVDGRSVAMGESFAAVRNNPAAIIYNPAGLAAVKRAQASYSQRNKDWTEYLEDYRFLQFTAIVPTPLAVFGLSYSRYQLGELIVTGPAGPEPIARVHPYDHTIALTAARSLDCGLDAGIALKMFDIRSAGVVAGHLSTTPAFLVDLGFIYSFFSCGTETSKSNELTLGVSFQNLGSYFKLKDEADNFEGMESPPRFLHVGIAYNHIVLPENDGSLVPISVLLSAQFTGLLNQPTLYPNQTTTAGFGFETTVFEIVTGRIGGYASPTNSIYGNEGTFALRYGFGVTIPLAKLEVAPIRVGFDDGIIPLNSTGSAGIGAGSNKSALNTFSFIVTYENGLF